MVFSETKVVNIFTRFLLTLFLSCKGQSMTSVCCYEMPTLDKGHMYHDRIIYIAITTKFEKTATIVTNYVMSHILFIICKPCFSY